MDALKKFFHSESAGGVVLFVAAILALVMDNSPLQVFYEHFISLNFGVEAGTLHLKKPLILWVNDGLMAIFFLYVGLEIKRELLVGELNSLRKVALPGIGAIGGMVVPALVYILFNVGDHYALRGWAIPAATDIAFALGVLSLLGNRVPLSLKIFLTALAIFDDLGAIVVIAIFYTADISLFSLSLAGLGVGLLALINRMNVSARAVYLFVGLFLWLCVLKSGVHATLAGVAIAFFIPMQHAKDPTRSPLKELEHSLHPWVSFFVLPVFAFSNAGVSFSGMTLDQVFSPIPLGIGLGLLVGKQLGIFGLCYLAIKLRIASMPSKATWLGIYAVSVLCGIGFTMSLFIGALAFPEGGKDHAAMVRIGVLAGSLIAGIIGYLVLRFSQGIIEEE